MNSLEYYTEGLQSLKHAFGEHLDAVLADGVIDYHEAVKTRSVTAVYTRQVRSLKKELTLDLREMRAKYQLLIANAARGTKAELRREKVNTLAPYEHIKLLLDRLLLDISNLKDLSLETLEEIEQIAKATESVTGAAGEPGDEGIPLEETEAGPTQAPDPSPDIQVVATVEEKPRRITPLDPQNLTPAISLNRVRVIDLPDLYVDEGVKGKSGYELVSTQALAGLIRQRIDLLHLNPLLSDGELLTALDHCLRGRGARFRPGVLTAAEIVAQRIGRNLGYLLLALKRGDAINRAAREEWDDTYWAHWAGVNQVWLGGGVASGRLGERMTSYALSVFGEVGILDFGLEISPYGANLPLVGAARLAPQDIESALVFDFGSTRIKRGYAIYNDYWRELVELHCLPPVPTQWDKFERIFPNVEDAAAAFFGHIVSVITQTWHDLRTHTELPLARVIRISIAAYIRDGHPMEAQRGAYYHLRSLTGNLQSELAYQLVPRLGVVDLQLIRDGSAAATAYAGEENAAVITIGTPLGVGFPPPASKKLWSIGEDFVIVDESLWPPG